MGSCANTGGVKAHLGPAAGLKPFNIHQVNKVLEWPSKSPDLNPIEMLWLDLQNLVHAQTHISVAEFKQFCKEEWAKISQE